MKHIRLALTLGLFWIVLSGHFSAMLLGFGAVSVVLVAWFIDRMQLAPRNLLRPRHVVELPRYLAWLLGEVIKSNIRLARCIWHPRLPIDPSWSRLDTQLVSPRAKAMYANSITLTPGTLTTSVEDDHLMVHALFRSGIDELRDGEMEARIRRLDL